MTRRCPVCGGPDPCPQLYSRVAIRLPCCNRRVLVHFTDVRGVWRGLIRLFCPDCEET